MTTPAQPPPAKGRKKSPAANPVTWVIVLGVALAGGAYLLMRQRSTAAANAAGTGTATPTGSLEDFAGQIATLQSEIADLQSSAAQDEAGETGTGTTTTPPPAGGGGALKAPGGFSVTPHAGGANFGWQAVPGAKAYQLQVTGAGGKGTGTSHYDHAANATHASVSLAKGAYKARVRAGASTASLTGPWTPYKPFTVTAKAPAVKPPVVKGSGGTSGGGEGED